MVLVALLRMGGYMPPGGGGYGVMEISNPTPAYPFQNLNFVSAPTTMDALSRIVIILSIFEQHVGNVFNFLPRGFSVLIAKYLENCLLSRSIQARSKLFQLTPLYKPAISGSNV